MKVGSGEKLFVIAVISAFLAYGSSAKAQTAVSQKVQARLAAAAEKLQAACGGDLSKYCSAVTPGEGRLIFCMMAYEDKLS